MKQCGKRRNLSLPVVSFPAIFSKAVFIRVAETRYCVKQDEETFNPLADMPILCSSNSTANKDMMLKIWTNGDTYLIELKTLWGKRRNCSLGYMLIHVHQNEYME